MHKEMKIPELDPSQSRISCRVIMPLSSLLNLVPGHLVSVFREESEDSEGYISIYGRDGASDTGYL